MADAAACTSYECYSFLGLCEIVQCVDDDLLSALDGTGDASVALAVVDAGKSSVDLVSAYHFDCVLRTSQSAVSAAYAALEADFHSSLRISFRLASRLLDADIRNHLDLALRARSVAVSASNALVCVDLRDSEFDLDRVVSANLGAVAESQASVFSYVHAVQIDLSVNDF